MKKRFILAAGVVAAGSALLALVFTGNLAALPGLDHDAAAGGNPNENETDRAAIVRLSLEWALVDQDIPDYALLKDPKNVVLSLENIDAVLVPELAGVNLIPLTPQEIQNKANKEGDFLHLVFRQLEVRETRATVSLDNTWAVAEDSNKGYLSGGGCILEFHKEAGQWVLEPLRSCWIA